MSSGPNLGLVINKNTGDAFAPEFRFLLRALDVLIMGTVISRTLSAPPGSPANGDRYIVGASPTGGWSSFPAGSFVTWTTDDPANTGGYWEQRVPKTGWLVYSIADVKFYYYSGSAWTVFPGGGGGGETYPVVGTPLLPGNRSTSTVNGLNGYTVWAQIPGSHLVHLAATWKVRVAACGGTGISINKAFVVRTLPNKLVPVDSTQIQFSGSNSYAAAFGTTPTVSAPAIIVSDAIALQLDTAHDYWIGFYFDNDGTGYNAALFIFVNPVSPLHYGQYQGGGDHTADNPLTTTEFDTQAPLFWDFIFAS